MMTAERVTNAAKEAACLLAKGGTAAAEVVRSDARDTLSLDAALDLSAVHALTLQARSHRRIQAAELTLHLALPLEFSFHDFCGGPYIHDHTRIDPHTLTRTWRDAPHTAEHGAVQAEHDWRVRAFAALRSASAHFRAASSVGDECVPVVLAEAIEEQQDVAAVREHEVVRVRRVGLELGAYRDERRRRTTRRCRIRSCTSDRSILLVLALVF